MKEQIELLAATLGITAEEAAEMLEEQAITNMGNFGVGEILVPVECPFTGTIEIMVIRGRDE